MVNKTPMWQKIKKNITNPGKFFTSKAASTNESSSGQETWQMLKMIDTWRSRWSSDDDDYKENAKNWTVSNLKVVPQWVVTLHHEATKSFVIALKFCCHHNIYDRHHTMTTSSSSSSRTLPTHTTHCPPSPKLTQPPLSLGSQSQRVCLEFALFEIFRLRSKRCSFCKLTLYENLMRSNLTRLWTSSVSSPPFSSSMALFTSLTRNTINISTTIMILMRNIMIMNLRLLTPKSFAESRQAALRAGYSPGVKHSNDFKLPRILPSKIKHGHFL